MALDLDQGHIFETNAIVFLYDRQATTHYKYTLHTLFSIIFRFNEILCYA